MRKLTLIALLLAALVACVPTLPHPSDNVDPESTGISAEENTSTDDLPDSDEPAQSNMDEESEQEAPSEENSETELAEPDSESLQEQHGDLPVKQVVEGDLVDFPNLEATDPDGDPITYTFTSPLNNEGIWQTEVGDAGEYLVTITASDGVNTVSQEVIIIVDPQNKPPIIDIKSTIETKEGETLTLEPEISDPDGDEVTISFNGWMTTDTKEIGYKDAGTHEVVITATDDVNQANKEVIIKVANTNRPPVIENLAPITIKEGETASVDAAASDPDGDAVTIDYGFPLDETGTWTPEVGDAGDYEIQVTASDGSLQAETLQLISVEALNRPPVIELDSPVTVKEGETVTLEPIITDKEGDEIRVSYSGWMTSSSKKTDFDDAGEHDVAIIARDTAGNEARHDIVVIIEDVNRPPQFGAGAFN